LSVRALALGALLVAGRAEAKDSLWLTCRATTNAEGVLVANVLERRSDDGAHRSLDVALIKGANIMTGTVANTDEKRIVTLRYAKNKGAAFAGRAELRLATEGKGPDRLMLDGNLDGYFRGLDAGKMVPVKLELRCETLED